MRKLHAVVEAVSVYNEYPVYPEQQGEEDRPRNPYAPT